MLSLDNYPKANNGSARYWAASVLLAAAGSAFAAEPALGEADFPHTRKAICEFNKVKAATPEEYKACEKYNDIRRPNLTDKERIIAVDAACFQRHKAHHISFNDRCRADLYVYYNLPATVKPSVPGQAAAVPQQSTAAESCAKGAAVGALTVIGVHAAALVADVFGCAGACTAAAATWSIGVKGAVVVGCVGGVAQNAIESAGEKQEGYVKPPQRPAPK